MEKSTEEIFLTRLTAIIDSGAIHWQSYTGKEMEAHTQNHHKMRSSDKTAKETARARHFKSL